MNSSEHSTLSITPEQVDLLRCLLLNHEHDLVEVNHALEHACASGNFSATHLKIQAAQASMSAAWWVIAAVETLDNA